MLINAVFEGGGVKGIALAGAVSVAERRGYRFNNVAGTSSGSIIASLLAAGYTGNEIRNLIIETPFISFIQNKGFYNTQWIGPIFRFIFKQGLYSGDKLERWMEQVLWKKGVRTFHDLRANQLRIVASDITQGKLLVLPDDIADYGIDPMSFTVAKAVRMSTCIPYFFEPVILKAQKRKKSKPLHPSIYIVDGGLLSNFPLWLFNDDEHSPNPSKIPTLGFRLVGSAESMDMDIHGPISMLDALFHTMMDAHDERYIEETKSALTIKIPTLGVKVTDFNIKKEMSLKLYESGIHAANKFFDKTKLPT